jgi:hypothetical protein
MQTVRPRYNSYGFNIIKLSYIHACNNPIVDFYVYYHMMITYGSKYIVQVLDIMYLQIVLKALQFIIAFSHFISGYGIIA